MMLCLEHLTLLSHVYCKVHKILPVETNFFFCYHGPITKEGERFKTLVWNVFDIFLWQLLSATGTWLHHDHYDINAEFIHLVMIEVFTILDTYCIMNGTSNSGIDSTSASVFAIVNTVISVCPIILHGIGIHLLRHINLMETSQKRYLTNLSLVETLFALAQDVLVNVRTFVREEIWFQYIQLLAHVVGFWWCDVMIMLTIDRLLHVYLNIKYDLYITSTKIKIMVIMCYLVPILTIVPLIAVQNITIERKLQIAKLYLLPIFGALLVIAFISTYGYIYLRIKIARRRERSQPQRQGQPRQDKSIFLPFWIIITFIVFIVLPEVFYIVLVYQLQAAVDEMLVYQINCLFWNVGLTVDALLYIFLNEPVKQKFYRMLGRSSPNTQIAPTAAVLTRQPQQTSGLWRHFIDHSKVLRKVLSQDVM